MRFKVWGARGSIPAPGPETMRYGGNTSCAEVTLSDGSTLILDAGTGIRNLGLALPRTEQPVHILLTHLHLDHIQGLMFFAPCFRPESEIVIWGPASPEASLRDRIARYISAPLAPVEVRELPSLVSFREAEPVEWEIGPARVRAQARRMLLFHHDPLHSDDFLDSFRDTVTERWQELGGAPDAVQLAAERHEHAVESAPVRASA